MIQSVRHDMDGATTEQYDCERLITDIKNKIATYEKDNVQEKYAQLEKLEEERDLFQLEIDKLKADVRVKLDKIEKLGNLTYDENCNHCMSNPFTLDAMENKKTLEKDKELAGKYLTKKSRMDDKIQKMFKIRAFKKDLDDLGQSYVEGNSRHTHLVSNLKYLQERDNNLENQLTLITTEIQKSIDQQHDVVYNQSIGKQIEDLKGKKYLLDDDASDLSIHMTTLHGNIQVLKTKETQINDNINKVEELEGLKNAYTTLAASKDSFVHKHNLTIKVLTSLRSNLQTHRAKLKSDTDERLKYYDGYIVALKARTDQEFAAILEHLGVKTDEHIGETLAAMHTASAKARQEMMDNIPVHEKVMQGVYGSYAEALKEIRIKDADIQKNFADRYGIDMKEIFDEYYKADSNSPADGGEPEGDFKPEANEDDLLS